MNLLPSSLRRGTIDGPFRFISTPFPLVVCVSRHYVEKRDVKREDLRPSTPKIINGYSVLIFHSLRTLDSLVIIIL